MINLFSMRVTAPPETALKKLSRAGVEVFSLSKSGAYTTFCIREKNVKKVFAIFSHPCYNVCVVKYGFVRSTLARILSRAGLIVGAALFAAAICLSQCFVFTVKVEGGGAWLEPEILSILSSEGVSSGALYRGADKKTLTARIMALPGVTFCSMERRGTAFIVHVECGEEGISLPVRSPLVSPVAGEVIKIVAVCGTPCVEVGAAVSVGERLIEPYFVREDGEREECLCSGYARILVSASLSHAAAEESEEALSAAVAATLLYSPEAEVKSYSVRKVSEGVIYTINFCYIYTASINMQ